MVETDTDGSAHREGRGAFEQALRALEHLPETRQTQEQAIDLRFELRTALLPLGVQVQSVGVRDPGELDRAFASMKAARASALIVESSSMLFAWRERLADLALKNRLHTMFAQRQYAEAGGLMAYAADFSDLFRRTATFVDKILKGAKPSDLPVEQPTKREFVINLKTAKALGLTIPQTLLLRADQVIDQ